MTKEDLKEIEFVIFDVETTGLSPFNGDRMVEVAALKMKNSKEISQFHSLINPQREISPEAFAVNHISSQMLEDAPLSQEILPAFLDFCKGCCLTGYNVNFDISFVNNELSFLNQHLPEEAPVIDILKMSRNLLPNLDSHSLSSVVNVLGLKQNQEHRALSDVRLTTSVFKHFLNILQEKGINKFSNLFSLFGLNHFLAEDKRQEKLDGIQQAIDLGIELLIKYFSGSTGEVSERKINPLEIKREGNKDMVIAYCHLRKEKRTFSLDRILNLEML